MLDEALWTSSELTLALKNSPGDTEPTQWLQASHPPLPTARALARTRQAPKQVLCNLAEHSTGGGNGQKPDGGGIPKGTERRNDQEGTYKGQLQGEARGGIRWYL